MQILKVISLLLDYPEPEVLAGADELKAAVQASSELKEETRTRIQTFIDELVARDIYDAQEDYETLFGRGRSLSLLLFEHVHGESRDRGQAMVDLMAIYQEHGLDISQKELPDYIPLYLEFLSMRPVEEVIEGLADVAHILGMLAARLHERECGYAVLMDSLLEISEEPVDVGELRETAAAEERDDTPEALDKLWEEEAVTFTAGDKGMDGCGSKSPVAPNQPETQTQPMRWVNPPSATAQTAGGC